MKIHGLQKMTLLDYPGKVACTVFLGGCDLRCPFCHNSELLSADAPAELGSSELLAFLEKRRGLLDGVAVTGGEPLLRPDLPELLTAIRALGYPVKLDTNGTHPDALRRVIDAGLADYVAMDVKNAPVRYAETVGLDRFDTAPVGESIRILLEGKTDYEFRTTAVEQLHDADSFRGMGEWIRGAKRWYLQPFADRDTVPFGGLCAPEEAKLEEYLEIMRRYVEHAELRGV